MILKNNMLVVIEGCRGVGKGTFTQALSSSLREDGYTVSTTTEPTKGMYGQGAILRLSRGQNDIETTMLFCLDRKQHIESIQSELPPRTIIICDRYSLSTMVYQPAEHKELIMMIHEGIPKPDLTILIDSDHDTWLEGNMEAFVTQKLYNRRSGDRSNLRNGDKNPEVYNAFRARYIEAVNSGIVGDHSIIAGFQSSEDMVGSVLGTIISKHSEKFGRKWRT